MEVDIIAIAATIISVDHATSPRNVSAVDGPPLLQALFILIRNKNISK